MKEGREFPFRHARFGEDLLDLDTQLLPVGLVPGLLAPGCKTL